MFYLIIFLIPKGEFTMSYLTFYVNRRILLAKSTPFSWRENQRRSEKIELIHPISSTLVAENWSQASIFHSDRPSGPKARRREPWSHYREESQILSERLASFWNVSIKVTQNGTSYSQRKSLRKKIIISVNSFHLKFRNGNM